MKIALVHMRHAGTGGTERYMNQLSAYLAERGHEVTIVCRSHEESPHPAIRFVVLHNLAIGNAWRMWGFAQAVERHVASENYDVVFGLGKTWTHDVFRMGGGCQSSYLELAHEATQNWIENKLGPGPKPRLALLLEKRSLAPGAFRRIITNSEWVKRDVMRLHGIDPALIEVIYNGVDLHRFHPECHRQAGAELRRKYGYADSDHVVLFLGTNYGRKGLDRVLKVFPQFAARHANARLLVAGYDSGSARYEAMARQLGIDRLVRFIGGRRDPEVCYAAGDVYIIPTRFDPFANSTLEALATGLPVITTPTNGGGELITEDREGSVIQTDEQLLQSMLAWQPRCRDPEVRAAARALAEKHPKELTAEQSTRVLEQVADEKRAAKTA